MPIYEYQCESCQHTFEVWQKITEGPVKKCESCGSKKVSKLISQSSFHLKGTGWYLTDYSRKNGSSETKSSQKSSDSTSSASTSTSESSASKPSSPPESSKS